MLDDWRTLAVKLVKIPTDTMVCKFVKIIFGIDPNNPLKMSVSEKGGSYYPNIAICIERIMICKVYQCKLPCATTIRIKCILIGWESRWIWGVAAAMSRARRLRQPGCPTATSAKSLKSFSSRGAAWSQGDHLGRKLGQEMGQEMSRTTL